ncbi:MAG: thrombospondin type 3 repeat-containing protein, partial [Verrucomicrobiota bacterium]
GSGADLAATVRAEGAVLCIEVFWGGSDGGTNSLSWSNSASLGCFTNLTADVLHGITGLGPNTNIFYTFRATNCSDVIWASPSVVFQTAGLPGITDTGATFPVPGSATLNGRLTNGNVADVIIYYGVSDGGTDPANWDSMVTLGTEVDGVPFGSTISGLLYGQGYVYRSYATNDVGDAWAPVSTPFKLPRPNSDFDLTGGLVLWLDGADSNTVFADVNATMPATNNGPVLRWNDKSGHGHDMWSLSAANPLFRSGAANLNGHSAVAFNANQLGRKNLLGITGNDDRTVIAVWANAINFGANYQHTIHVGNPVGNQTYGHSVYRGGNSRIGNHYWAAGFDSTAVGSPASTIAISAWDGDGGSGANGLDEWFVNGVPSGSSDRAPLNTGDLQCRIGSRLNGPVEGIQGDIAEILVYDRVLSTAEQLEVGRYLTIKYDLNTTYTTVLDTAGVGVANVWATNIASTTADLVGFLSATGAVYDVTVFYGLTDGGTNPAAWDASVSLGSFADVATTLNQTVGGLTPGTNVFFAWRATNCLDVSWGQPSLSFMTSTNNVDTDGDGFPDCAEVIANTDPLDPASFLWLLITRTGTSDVHTLIFPSSTGRTYRVERSADLVSGPWVIVQSNLTSTGGLFSTSRTNPAGRVYYRIGVESP